MSGQAGKLSSSRTSAGSACTSTVSKASKVCTISSTRAGEAVQGGARRVLALVTSAYASYSGCRQYRENLYDALAEVRAPR